MVTLYRIMAVSDFSYVKAGEVGGFIEKEDNLSQDGESWVYGNAKVYGNAQIFFVSGIGSRFGTTTFFLCKDKKIRAVCGCFYGDLDEFASKVQATHAQEAPPVLKIIKFA